MIEKNVIKTIIEEKKNVFIMRKLMYISGIPKTLLFWTQHEPHDGAYNALNYMYPNKQAPPLLSS